MVVVLATPWGAPERTTTCAWMTMRAAPAGERFRRLSIGRMKESGVVSVVAQRARSAVRTKPPASRRPRCGFGWRMSRARSRAGPQDLSLFVGVPTQSPELDSRWNEPVTRAARSKRIVGRPREVIASGARRRLAKAIVWTSRSAWRRVHSAVLVVPVLVTTLRCEPVSEMSYVAVEPASALADTAARTVAP